MCFRWQDLTAEELGDIRAGDVKITWKVGLACRFPGPAPVRVQVPSLGEPGILYPEHHIQLSGDSDPEGPGTTLGKLKPREGIALVQSPTAEPQATSLACCKDQMR